MDMRVGIDIIALEPYAEIIKGLFRLDPRGAHFLHPDVVEAVKVFALFRFLLF